MLIVEDDRRLAESLRRSLMESRMAVDITHDVEDGLAAASTTPNDVIVLDVMLPLLDGLEVTRRLREHKVKTPILMNVEVADEGPGVPLGHRDKLFTRFSRADSARSPEDGGAGLGLALSAAIARAHGGTLELVLTKGPGAVFKLHMPNGEAGRPSPKPTPRL